MSSTFDMGDDLSTNLSALASNADSSSILDLDSSSALDLLVDQSHNHTPQMLQGQKQSMLKMLHHKSTGQTTSTPGSDNDRVSSVQGEIQNNNKNGTPTVKILPFDTTLNEGDLPSPVPLNLTFEVDDAAANSPVNKENNLNNNNVVKNNNSNNNIKNDALPTSKTDSTSSRPAMEKKGKGLNGTFVSLARKSLSIEEAGFEGFVATATSEVTTDGLRENNERLEKLISGPPGGDGDEEASGGLDDIRFDFDDLFTEDEDAVVEEEEHGVIPMEAKKVAIQAPTTLTSIPHSPPPPPPPESENPVAIEKLSDDDWARISAEALKVPRLVEVMGKSKQEEDFARTINVTMPTTRKMDETREINDERRKNDKIQLTNTSAINQTVEKEVGGFVLEDTFDALPEIAVKKKPVVLNRTTEEEAKEEVNGFVRKGAILNTTIEMAAPATRNSLEVVKEEEKEEKSSSPPVPTQIKKPFSLNTTTELGATQGNESIDVAPSKPLNETFELPATIPQQQQQQQQQNMNSTWTGNATFGESPVSGGPESRLIAGNETFEIPNFAPDHCSTVRKKDPKAGEGEEEEEAPLGKGDEDQFGESRAATIARRRLSHFSGGESSSEVSAPTSCSTSIKRASSGALKRLSPLKKRRISGSGDSVSGAVPPADDENDVVPLDSSGATTGSAASDGAASDVSSCSIASSTGVSAAADRSGARGGNALRKRIPSGGEKLKDPAALKPPRIPSGPRPSFGSKTTTVAKSTASTTTSSRPSLGVIQRRSMQAPHSRKNTAEGRRESSVASSTSGPTSAATTKAPSKPSLAGRSLLPPPKSSRTSTGCAAAGASAAEKPPIGAGRRDASPSSSARSSSVAGRPPRDSSPGMKRSASSSAVSSSASARPSVPAPLSSSLAPNKIALKSLAAPGGKSGIGVPASKAGVKSGGKAPIGKAAPLRAVGTLKMKREENSKPPTMKREGTFTKDDENEAAGGGGEENGGGDNAAVGKDPSSPQQRGKNKSGGKIVGPSTVVKRRSGIPSISSSASGSSLDSPTSSVPPPGGSRLASTPTLRAKTKSPWSPVAKVKPPAGTEHFVCTKSKN